MSGIKSDTNALDPDQVQNILRKMEEMGFGELLEPLDKQKEQSTPCYVICLARRFFNLQYFWEKMKKAQKGDSEDDSKSSRSAANIRFTNENGILTYANEIADYYIQNHGVFPQILIYDDFLISGDKSALCIVNLRDAVFAAVRDMRQEADQDKITADLVESVEVRVLAKSEYKENIPLELLWVTDAQDSYDVKTRHEKSDEITEILNSMDNASTTYLLSVRLDNEAYSNLAETVHSLYLENFKKLWAKASAEFDGFQADQYFYRFPENVGVADNALIASVRVYQKGGCAFITPFVLHPEMEYDEDFKPLFKWVVSKVFAGDQFSSLTNRLLKSLQVSDKIDGIKDLLFQVFEMLVGQIVLNTFMQDAGINLNSVHFDTGKIARNYGKLIVLDKQNEHDDEWEQIIKACRRFSEENCNGKRAIEALADVIPKGVPCAKWDAVDTQSTHAEDDASKKEDMNQCAANIIYDLAVDTKKDQLDLRRRRRPSASRYIRFSEYYENLSNEQEHIKLFETAFMTKCLKERIVQEQGLIKLIASIALMADLGYMSFPLRHSNKRSGFTFRHSEMTMLLYPKLFGKKDWEVIKPFLQYSVAIQSSIFSLQDAAQILIRKLGYETNSCKAKAISNMTNALQDNRLFLSILEWDPKFNR